MKHAVIPTDFSFKSLQVIHDLVHYYPDEPVKITLLHLVDLPLAIGDLLFRLQRTESRFPVPQPFAEACEMMMNRYAVRITQLRPLIQYGATAAYLTNLLEGLGTDAVYIQQGFEPGQHFDDSVKMLPLFRKTGYRIIETTPAPLKKSISPTAIGNLLVAGR